jgi:hypothetical protein
MKCTILQPIISNQADETLEGLQGHTGVCGRPSFNSKTRRTSSSEPRATSIAPSTAASRSPCRHWFRTTRGWKKGTPAPAPACKGHGHDVTCSHAGKACGRASVSFQLRDSRARHWPMPWIFFGQDLMRTRRSRSQQSDKSAIPESLWAYNCRPWSSSTYSTWLTFVQLEGWEPLS